MTEETHYAFVPSADGAAATYSRSPCAVLAVIGTQRGRFVRLVEHAMTDEEIAKLTATPAKKKRTKRSKAEA